MNNTRYNVIFSGEIISGHNIDDVKKSIARLYKVPIERCERFFTGNEIAIKQNIDQVTAEKYKQVFERIGAKCRIEPISEIAEDEKTSSETDGESNSCGNSVNSEIVEDEKASLQDASSIESNVSNNEDNNYKIIFCSIETCNQKLRVPINRGMIRVTCPTCKNSFLYNPDNNSIEHVEDKLTSNEILKEAERKIDTTQPFYSESELKQSILNEARYGETEEGLFTKIITQLITTVIGIIAGMLVLFVLYKFGAGFYHLTTNVINIAQTTETKEAAETPTERPTATPIIKRPTAPTTRKEFEGSGWLSKRRAWSVAKRFIEQGLKYPAESTFPWYDSSFIKVIDDYRYEINSYVDASNALGVRGRVQFAIVIERNKDEWVLQSIETDGDN